MILQFASRTHKDFQGKGAHRLLVSRMMADFTGDVMVISGEVSAGTERVRQAGETQYHWVGTIQQ